MGSPSGATLVVAAAVPLGAPVVEGTVAAVVLAGPVVTGATTAVAGVDAAAVTETFEESLEHATVNAANKVMAPMGSV